MAKGYWVAMVNVSDTERYGKYAQATAKALEKYGGTPIVRGGQNQSVEGNAFQRIVVLEFPSYDAAVECYHSPEYQEAKAIQEGAAERHITIVEGV